MHERSLSKESFQRELHGALGSLYDNAALRKSPLLDWLRLAERSNPVLALQETLTEEIHRLKPGRLAPLQSRGQRIYGILQYRFLEQLGQKEAAAELLLSVRHLRRLEVAALEELAESLWARYNLSSLSPLTAIPLELPPDAPLAPASTALDRELAWAQESLPEETATPALLLETVVETLGPLIRAKGVRVEAHVEGDLPPVAGKLALMRQAINELGVRLIAHCSGGSLILSAGRACEGIFIALEGLSNCEESSSGAEQEFDPGEVTRALVEAFGGRLEIPAELQASRQLVKLLLPAAQAAPVLVVDDNLDALLLTERFLAGSRFAFVGVREPAQVVETAIRAHPRAILLDVMLPGVDGWELLGRLREHPDTRATPVIVCTFLEQETLALALGAAAFLRKPLTRRG